MDQTEFTRRVLANPHTTDQEILDAARSNPGFQEILHQARRMDTEIAALLHSAPVPAELKHKLLKLPDAEVMAPVSGHRAADASAVFQYFAMAASLLLAVGVSFALIVRDGPSPGDLVFGNQVLQHLYVDLAEINAVTEGRDRSVVAMPAINDVLLPVGSRLASGPFDSATPVRNARPCNILSAFQSAHLILQGRRGAVNVIVINNPPVDREYRIRDQRFSGMVVPVATGNLILVGEVSEDLQPYRLQVTDSMEWLI